MPGMVGVARRPVLLALAAFGMLAGFLAGGAPAAEPAATGAGTADYAEVTGFLDESATSFLLRQIRDSQDAGSAMLIVRVDSPGPVDASIDPLLHAMVESSVPVVVWVAPGDARAGSGAAALVLAAHRAVMAPEATIGPASPMDLRHFASEDSGDDGSTRTALEQVAADRRRTLDEGAVDRLLSIEIDAEEALDMGMIDGVEPTVQELLQSTRGVEVSVAGEPVALPDEPLTLRFVKMSLLERLTHSATRPEFAYLLLLVGFFGIIFELYNPGLGAGGVAGAAALGFAFHAFTALGVSWLAVAAIVLALFLLTADLSEGRLGAVSALGIGALVGGTWLLYRGADPEIRLDWWAGVAGIVATVLFFVSVMTSAVRARTAKPLPGAEGILEAVGVARTDIAPDGQVMARGTLWRARTLGAAIGQGTPVKVKGVSGLMLMVEPTEESPDSGDLEGATVPDGEA